ncbi:MAG: 5'/3'-nucleotidase SurE [Anaerolineales bacterium]|nr:5'/3'-nucleotidase SurE [Anaerolineales bacterium]MCS7246705.1 5'/3'-nucleotidase SurE [Anaerolineales bacterium]MDW8160515.1 5'/3'-nucleotidase SurE [Anaerolineales bacterium]MDW8446526.1 5'/3'-nucleotidase SurE [Anaerolineales bacterium]
MHILVTNDDGVLAPGLLALAQAMRELGEVSIVAPEQNWSASGHVKTMHRPLRVKEVRLHDGSRALASDGAPSDCVALALLGLVKQPVNLVVSGVNPNANIGHDVTYSGTVTAAMEAVITGNLPAIALSLDGSRVHTASLDYAPAATIAKRIARKVLEKGLPQGVFLNVNIPYLPLEQIKGFRITRQGLRVYRDALEQRIDPRGQPYYWIGGEAPTAIPEEGTDYEAIANGYVSITPLQLDLTAWSALKALQAWGWE